MRIPRQVFTVTGAAALLVAIAIGATTFSQGRTDYTAFASGYTTPDPTPDPTTDPCIQASAVGEDPCVTVTEETPPKTHTPTPEGTPESTVEVPTEPATTATTAPPVATSTPSGDAGAGGLTPPSTGSHGDTGAASVGWLVIAGLALAAGGTAALGYGLRRS